MKKIEIYEQAMCCSTGVCGPGVDSELLRISSLFDSLKNNGEVNSYRYNLTSNPQAFITNEKILELVKNEGNDILPITLLNGEVIKTGSYPSSEELGVDVKIKEKSACCSNVNGERKLTNSTHCC